MKNPDLIPKNHSVIIDANIFIYANQRVSNQCMNFLESCADKQIHGILLSNIVAEITHVLMLAEARDLGLITGSNPARQLSEHPNKIKGLHRYETLIRDIFAMGLQFEPIIKEDFLTSFSIQKRYGLMTNDSLLIAAAMRLRVNNVFSADSIFKTISEINLYSPTDLKQ